MKVIFQREDGGKIFESYDEDIKKSNEGGITNNKTTKIYLIKLRSMYEKRVFKLLSFHRNL